MSEVSETYTQVLPSTISMEWAAENPGGDTPFAEHLIAYTQARKNWAEAIQEAHEAQEDAAELQDRAADRLGLMGGHLQNIMINPDVQQYFHRGRAWFDGVRLPVRLGRTSLFAVSYEFRDFATVTEGKTHKDKIMYGYGKGRQAIHAWELEADVVGEAMKAADTIEQSTLPNPEKAVWSTVLRASDRYAQLDPESFVIEGTRLVSEAEVLLQSARWVAVFGRDRLVAATLATPALVIDEYSEAHIATNKVSGILTAYHASSGRHLCVTGDDGGITKSYKPHYPRIEDPERLTLLDQSSIDRSPETSFKQLRGLMSGSAATQAADGADTSERYLASSHMARPSSDTATAELGLVIDDLSGNDHSGPDRILPLEEVKGALRAEMIRQSAMKRRPRSMRRY